MSVVQSVIDLIRAHPLAAAAAWMLGALAADVVLGALDGLIRWEFSPDKLPQVLETKLVNNVWARALLGLLAGVFFSAQAGGQVQDLLKATLTAAIGLYSVPISRDVLQKLGFVVYDLWARLSGNPYKALPLVTSGQIVAPGDAPGT